MDFEKILDNVTPDDRLAHIEANAVTLIAPTLFSVLNDQDGGEDDAA